MDEPDTSARLLAELAGLLLPGLHTSSGVTSCFLHAMAKSYSVHGLGLPVEDRGRSALAVALEFGSEAELLWCVSQKRLQGTMLAGAFGNAFINLLHARARPLDAVRDGRLLQQERLRALNNGDDLDAEDFFLLLRCGAASCVTSAVTGWYTWCYKCGARSSDRVRPLELCPCLGVAYCSEACRSADWDGELPKHKYLCKELREGSLVVAPVKAPPRLAFFTKVRFLPTGQGRVEFLWPGSPSYSRYADRLTDFPSMAESWEVGRTHPPGFSWALGASWATTCKRLGLDAELNTVATK